MGAEQSLNVLDTSKVNKTTIINNTNLTNEEKKQFNELFLVYPVKVQCAQWVELDDLVRSIEEELSPEDIRVIVKTGGMEIYSNSYDDNSNVFLFNSASFKKTDEMKLKLTGDEIGKVVTNPTGYHKKELSRLTDFLKGKEGQPVKIIEGDIGHTGLSAARLCAIYATVMDKHPAKIIVGCAYGNIFDHVRPGNIKLNGWYEADFRKTLSLGEVPHRVIIPSEFRYIRRAGEIFGIDNIEDLEEDLLMMRRYYTREANIHGAKRDLHLAWYKGITLKKIERVKENERKNRDLNGNI